MAPQLQINSPAHLLGIYIFTRIKRYFVRFKSKERAGNDDYEANKNHKMQRKTGEVYYFLYIFVNTWKILHWESGRQVSSVLQVLSTSSTAPRPQTIKQERTRSQYTRLCDFEPHQSLSMVDPRSLMTERLQLRRLPCHNWFKLVWGFTLPGKIS